MDQHTDETNLGLWTRKRDADAFAAIVSRHAKMVFATCRRILGDATEAEDVTQDCFLNLASPGGQPQGNPAARLHALATYRSFDRLRSLSRRRQRELAYAAEQQGPVEQQWDDIEPHVDAAIDELPADIRELVVRHYLEGQSYSELATVTGLSRATVARRVKDGIEIVRESLARRGINASSAAILFGFNNAALMDVPETLGAALGKMAIAGAGLKGTVVVATAGGLIVSKKLAAVGIGIVLVLAASYCAREFVGREASRPEPLAVVAKGTQPAATPRRPSPAPEPLHLALPDGRSDDPKLDPDFVDTLMASLQVSQSTSDTITWEGIQPEDIPTDNGMHYFLQAIKLLPRIDGAWLDEVLENIEANGWRDDPKLEEFLEQCKPSFDALRKGLEVGNAQVPKMTNGPEELLGYLQYYRLLARLMTLESQQYVARGDYSAAFKNYSDLLRFSSESVRGAPLIGDLVGVAVQNIAAESATASFQSGSYADLQAFASSVTGVAANQPTSAQSLANEAEAFSDWFYTRFETPEEFYSYLQNYSYLENWGEGFIEDQDRFIAVTSPAKVYSLMEDALVRYQSLGPYLDMPYYELQQYDLSGLYADNPFADALLPDNAIANVARADARAAAQLDSLEIMTALELYRHDQGTYPQSLNALSPQYIVKPMTDPFTGHAYEYRPSAGSYQLYSPGPDQIDNGGENNNWKDEGGDLVFTH